MPRRYMLVLIIISIIVFGGAYLLIRSLLGNNTNSSSQESNSSQTTKAKKLSTDASAVRYTVYGRVVGEEDRRAVRITINGSSREIQVLQGYDESVVSSKKFSNKSSAFESFLLALESAGFTTRDISIKTDERGVCPLGRSYIYETDYSDSSSIRTWTTSCSSEDVSFRGDFDTVETLFQDQIPNYDNIVNNVVL